MAGNRGPVYRPSDKDRREVEALAQIGLTDELISRVKEIKGRTVRKHFREQLSAGRAKGLAALFQTAHQQALNGNTAVLIFLLKTRAGLQERNRWVDADGNPLAPSVNVNVAHQTVVKVPGMMDPEEWNRIASDHQRQILGIPKQAR